MNVLITGGAGFIGSHLVRMFCRAGHRVSAIVRASSSRTFIGRYDVKIIEGDLRERAFTAPAVGGFDLVVHAAAKATDWGGYSTFFEANVEAAMNLIESIDAKTRMIFLSSIAVMGEEDCPRAKDENEPYNPVCPYPFESLLPSGMNHYRLTKTLAEQMLRQKAALRGIDLTVLRPVWVFGPRESHAGPYEYCRSVQDGLPALPGLKTNRFHVVYVEDLARMVLRVAERQQAGVHVYNAGPPDAPLMDAYWNLFCRAMGRRKPMTFPPSLLYPLAMLLEILWTLVGAASPPLLTRARLYMFSASNVTATRRIRETFGFDDFTPLPRAVRKTVRWWRMNGYLS